jgi:hypothetical protein
MSMKVVANKRGTTLRPRIENVISVDSNEVLLGGTADVFGCGFVEIVMRIDGDSFKELAQAMMEANANEAFKAFGAATQSKPSTSIRPQNSNRGTTDGRER